MYKILIIVNMLEWDKMNKINKDGSLLINIKNQAMIMMIILINNIKWINMMTIKIMIIKDF